MCECCIMWDLLINMQKHTGTGNFTWCHEQLFEELAGISQRSHGRSRLEIPPTTVVFDKWWNEPPLWRTLVPWCCGAHFFIWPAQVTLLKDWSSCPHLYLFLFIFFLFVCFFGWRLVLPVWCPWISGDGSDRLDTLLAWLRPDELISQ